MWTIPKANIWDSRKFSSKICFWYCLKVCNSLMLCLNFSIDMHCMSRFLWPFSECQTWYPTSWQALAYPSKDYRMSNIVTHVMKGTFWTRTRHSRTRCSHPWMSQALLAILKAEITSCTGSAPTWSAGRFRCLCCSTIYTAVDESWRGCWRLRALNRVLKA